LSACTPFQARDTTQTHPNNSALVFLNLALGQFETQLSVNSSDFQIHFMTQHFGAFGRVVDLGWTHEISMFAAKTGCRVLAREAQNGSF
jgi:hypothetical protein